ncbi:Trafficking protein particle complex subunit 2-like protein [Vanrija pseudolonga]|uniref:Trafficking protein particle complex subunit 2-like protein n=1 Tax=Vanrija pseudolonga TaxID=143232 RepID=A0AAF0Y5X4_9TREE|nr:Trafficking protein particle complex subunit 2-like protein [Vanrija pseudolonga]
MADRPPAVPLHLTSLAILAPSNAPLYVHSFTGKDDEMRAYHLAHAAVDVIEERIVMNAQPNRPSDSYLGLLFCMEDMAFYGFQTPTKLRLVLSVALVDAVIKDADIVAIFRAVHQEVIRAIHNPFLSLPSSFSAVAAAPYEPAAEGEDGEGKKDGDKEVQKATAALAATRVGSTRRNEAVAEEEMFASGPADIKPAWLDSPRFRAGIERLGVLLNGGRA